MTVITEIIALMLYMSMAVTILIASAASATTCTSAGSKKLASYTCYNYTYNYYVTGSAKTLHSNTSNL